jgi:hypothetical protein
MNQTVEYAPLLLEGRHGGVNLGIFCHIAGQAEGAAEFGSHLSHTTFKPLVLIGKCQCCALGMAGLGHAVGN